MRLITLSILLFSIILCLQSCHGGDCVIKPTDTKLRFDSNETIFVPYNGHDTLVFKWDSSSTLYTFHTTQFEDTFYDENIYADCPEFIYHSAYRQIRLAGDNNSTIYFRLEKNSTAPTAFDFHFNWHPTNASITTLGHTIKNYKMFYPSLMIGNKLYQNVKMYMEDYGNDSLYVLVNRSDGILKFKNGQGYIWTLVERR